MSEIRTFREESGRFRLNFADQFAAINVAFCKLFLLRLPTARLTLLAISTSIGAVVGGQLYDHVPSGWAAVNWCVPFRIQRSYFQD